MYALSCASIMALFNCFYFLRGSLKFCVLVSMIQKIVHDIAYLLFMLILVVISFTIATRTALAAQLLEWEHKVGAARGAKVREQRRRWAAAAVHRAASLARPSRAAVHRRLG